MQLSSVHGCIDPVAVVTPVAVPIWVWEEKRQQGKHVSQSANAELKKLLYPINQLQPCLQDFVCRVDKTIAAAAVNL